MFPIRSALTGSLSICLLAACSAWAQTGVSPVKMESIARLPLAFEKQSEGPRTRFLARGRDYLLGLEGGKATIEVLAGDKARHAVSLEFAGARPRKAVPGDELPGKVNYIRGNDPRKWRMGVSTYSRVTYPNAYPGIDVVYYGNQQRLEFDLVVKPGADPRAIRLKIGGGKISLDDTGELKVEGSGGVDFRIPLPTVYQEFGGTRKVVTGRYVLGGAGEVAFQLEGYDKSRPVVIDPTIVYATSLGGSLGSTYGSAIAVDSTGNLLVAGKTSAADFPGVNASQTGYGGGAYDAFVTKFDPTGTSMIYSTFLGGTGSDFALGLAVDSAGAAWVTGSTLSNDFPVLNAAQPTGAGAFVAKLNAAGALRFSTYLGASNTTRGQGIAVDTAGNGYVTGIAEVQHFPTTLGVVQSSSPLEPFSYGAGFITKYGISGGVVYSSLLGAGNYGYGVAVDLSGNAYVTGWGSASSFPGAPAGGAQPFNFGNGDAFVAKFNPTATAVLYFTFLGGPGFDQGNSIAVDTSGNVYIAGQTTSAGIATPGAAQVTMAGATDGFVAKLNPSGSAFSYVTYLGGTRLDYVTGLAPDGAGNVYVTGYTDSANFPTLAPVQSAPPSNRISLFQSTDSGATFSAFDSNIPGAVTGISFNPTGNSVVVLTEAGIYRSTDSGTSWTQQFSQAFIGAQSYVSRSLASPGTLYAIDSICRVYRSADDGVTWNATGAPPCGQSHTLTADSLSADTVYVGFNGGVDNLSKSVNGGAIWSQSPSPLISSLAAAPDGSLFAGTYSTQVLRSTDHGGSWTLVDSGARGITPPPVYSLSISGTTVYAVVAGAIHKTVDGGNNWAILPSLANVYSVSASVQNASVVYALTLDGTAQQSSDGGVTWNAPGAGLSPTVFDPNAGLIVDPVNSGHVLIETPVPTAAFVAKVNATGSALTWSTYLGGTNPTEGLGVATDGDGSSFVAGYTMGAGFPFTSSTPSSGGYLAFVVKFSDGAATSPQTITFGPLSSQPLGSLPPPLSATASSGLPVSFASNTTTICTESGVNVTLLAPGTCSITASQVGNSMYAAAISVTQTFAVSGGTQTITFAPLSNQTLDAFTPVLNATASSGLTVTFVSNTTNVCTVIGVDVMLIAAGTCSITASQAGNAFYGAATPATQTFIVSAKTAQTITFGPLSDQSLGSTTPPLSATASSGLTVRFDTTTPFVCIIGAVNVILETKGTCSVRASQDGNSVYAAAAPVTQSFVVTSSVTTAGFQFVTVSPCRIMDTRNPNGPLGGPFLGGGTTRTIPIPSSTCSVPANASAYSLNVTVVPRAGALSYLTVWPTGQAQPFVSTLNSLDGSTIANAAIVPAGAAGAINAFATNDADLIVDINGYFVPPAANTLQFYPLAACRVLDTRNANGALGGPSIAGGSGRSFPIPSSTCGVPANAAAYAFNVTAVPQGALAYLTAWPTGQAQPFVSTLNSFDGTVLANAAIVPAGAGGAASFYASDTTGLVVDINGYFAPPGTGGLNFYPVTPCRLVDTRNANGTLGGPTFGAGVTRAFPLSQGSCGLPGVPNAQAYSLNMTVVPQGFLAYLSTWSAGAAQPVVSTLNAFKGQVVANAAIVVGGAGSIDVYATSPTDVIIDTNGYFGQ